MVDSIKESPVVNPRMIALAELVGKGKSLANKVQIPEAVPLLGGQRLGDMIVGRADEELQNWGYGNMPMQVPEMSNIPVMKTGRKDPFFDALMMLPLGGPGGEIIQSGMLPIKKKHAKYIDNWVEAGMYGGDMELSPNTPKVLNSLLKKSPVIQEDTKVYRILHPESRMASLNPGDVFKPDRVLSTTYNKNQIPEIKSLIKDFYSGEVGPKVIFELPAGTKPGGDLGSTASNIYDEFLIRPDQSFSVVKKNRQGITLKALTESEANLYNRKKD